MMNPPSCLIGNLPNNLDIDIGEAMHSEMVNGIPPPYTATPLLNGAASGQIDMAQLDAAASAQTPQYLAASSQLNPGQLPPPQQLSPQPQQQAQQEQKARLTWIQWFGQLEGHEFLLPVDRAFLQDKFNLI